MKRIIAIILLLLIISVKADASLESLSWYIKRNPGGTPTFPPESGLISEWGGYFLDRSANSTGEKIIYLTFDAGYANECLVSILDTLKEKEVPAAFFLLDNIILKNTDLVLRMGDEGHLVCNHTKRHRDLSMASEEEINNDLLALEEVYREKTGREMAKYFRFPEGRYSLNAIKQVAEMGYKTIFWSYAYEDWNNSRQPRADLAIKKTLNNTHPGAVMLFHPTSKTNAEILPILIDSWRSDGYSFGTLDQLCGRSKLE